MDSSRFGHSPDSQNTAPAPDTERTPDAPLSEAAPPSSSAVRFQTLRAAAARLGLDPRTLRKRCDDALRATAPASSGGDGSSGNGECPPSSAAESVEVQSSGRLHTIRTAAAHLGIDPDMLRRQCYFAGKGKGVADLGGGIFAFKVGRFWRIRFPWWE